MATHSIKKDYIKWKYGDRTPIEKLFFLYPDAEWNWRALSENPNTTWSMVEKNLEKPWNWDKLSAHPNITWEIIRDNPGLPWIYITKNPNITWDIIEKNRELFRHWNTLSANPNITLEIFEKYLDKWENYDNFSENVNIMQFVEKYPDKKWDWFHISCNKNLTWDFIEKYKNKLHINIIICIKNTNLTWKNIKDMLKDLTHYANYYFSKHPNVYWENILENPDINWQGGGISCNPNITWEIYQANKSKSYWTTSLSRNININWNIVKNNRNDKNISLYWYCLNPNLTAEIVTENINITADRGWFNISYNPFLYNDSMYKKSLASDIQMRKEKVSNTLKTHPKLYKDIVKLIVNYVGYR